MEANWGAYQYIYLWYPGVETAEKTVAFRFPQGYAAVGAIIDRFLEAHSHCTNTYIAVSRPGAADETDTYCNKVAPTARIYLHLICRKRHLPLKLRKGKTIGCGAKLSSALMFGEAHAVSYAVPNRATAKLSNALLGCVAVTVSTNVPNRATAITVSVGAVIRL